ncbi:uncharacterized protein LOC102487940 isoform X1 [Tupaia chinensis]|uniref:uncharacterized protein LOC102487940 isoform X1 n=1 Tax=Tupaia chinensis TaxID=246437 RepID=UPI000FFBE984|nr:uncharacterized protein LOC102487940 isoform X1 [Tupaia chinensis]
MGVIPQGGFPEHPRPETAGTSGNSGRGNSALRTPCTAEQPLPSYGSPKGRRPRCARSHTLSGTCAPVPPAALGPAKDAGASDSAGRVQGPGRSLCARAAASDYKGSWRVSGCDTPPTARVLLRVLLWISDLTSSRDGPQLLLRPWWFLHLCRLLQMQRMQMHLLQEEKGKEAQSTQQPVKYRSETEDFSQLNVWLQAAVPAALQAVRTVPRAACAKGHRTSAAAAPDGGQPCSQM